MSEERLDLGPDRDHQWEILHEVFRERIRQDELKARGRFEFTCADGALSDHGRLAILTEELGEVARDVCEHRSPREELIQVAAVALAWVEGLDRER